MRFLHLSTLRLRPWLLSALVSAVAIIVIGYEWLHVHRSYGEQSSVIRNQSQLGEFLLHHQDTVEFQKKEKPYRIPTGFFIQSLAFVTATEVNITGYIWQKYPQDFPANIVKGIVFPDEVESIDNRVDKVYEASGEQDGIRYDMIGWYFDVTFRQSFDYSDYPLDILTVRLRLWAKDFQNDERMILIPDFAAYAETNKPTFGLNTEIVHGEWEIDETFFSYNTIPYDTNFGFFDKAEEYSYKELFINVGVRRKFINAFVVNLVPLFVVALLLFAQLLTVSGEKDLIERFGFDVSATIATYSAALFIVLLAHVQVRSQFAGSGLTYIEYFYLIMYLIILLGTANSFIFALGNIRYLNLVRYRDNLIPKLGYWPFLLWLMAIVTWLAL